MPPVLIGIALIAGGAAAGASTIIGIGLSFVLSGVASLTSKKPKLPSFSNEASSRGVSVRQPISPWRVTYGRAGYVGGTITFIGTSGTNNEFLHLVITVNGHQIQSFDTLRFDGVAVPLDGSGLATGTFAGFVRCKFNLGTSGQAAFSDLITDMPSQWTANHRQRGRAGAYIRLKWNADLFPNGVPNITFDIHGHALVLDPRGPSTGYSENPALCLREFLTNTSYGLGVASADIDDASFIAAANVCDENVSLAAGGTEDRYTCNGSFETNQKPAETIRQLLGSMAGYLVYTGGKWSVYAGAWRSPTISIGDGDARDAIKVQTRLSKRDTCNGVKGVYVNPANNWKPSDFPAYMQNVGRGFGSDAYLVEDSNERIWRDIELPFTISAATAQRLAKIELERTRRQIAVQFPGRLTGYQSVPPDVIQLSHARFSWTNKTFEVQQCKLEIYDDKDTNAPVIGTSLTLRESDANVFAWTTAEELTVAALPSTTLPNTAVIASPTSLTLLSDETTSVLDLNGIRRPRIKASWTAPADQFVVSGGFIDIQLSPDAGSTWINAESVAGNVTQSFIQDVENGDAYLVRVRSRNAAGTVSAWVTSGSVTVKGGEIGAAFGKNLVANPGFEENAIGAANDADLTVGKALSDSWSVDRNDSTAFSVQRHTSSARSGAASAQITLKSSQSIGAGSAVSSICTNTAHMPLAIGDIIRVSGWVAFLTNSVPAGLVPQFQLGCYLFSGAGSNLGNILVTVTTGNGGTFTFYQGALTIPATIGGGVPAYAQFVIAATMSNGTGAPINSTTNNCLVIFDDLRLIIQNTAFDVTPINTAGTFTSTTTALSNTGANTTITVAARTMQFGDGQVSYNSGSVDPGSFGTWYVYADDPTFSGGAVTYVATATPSATVAANGRVFFGKITTTNAVASTGAGGGSGGGGPTGKGLLS